MPEYHHAPGRPRTATGRTAAAVWSALTVVSFATIAATPAAAQTPPVPPNAATIDPTPTAAQPTPIVAPVAVTPAAAQTDLSPTQLFSAGQTTLDNFSIRCGTATGCVSRTFGGITTAVALGAFNPGTVVNASNFTITTDGDVPPRTIAVGTFGGATINLTNGTIVHNAIATGTGGFVVRTQGPGDIITGNNVNITTAGIAPALQADGGTQITWVGGHIIMTGNTSTGSVVANGGTVDMTGTLLDVSQGVENRGIVNLHGVTLNSGSIGINSNGAAGSTTLIDGGSVTAPRPLRVSVGTGTFNVENGAVITAVPATGGVVQLMDVFNAGTANLNADHSTLTGSIITTLGSTSNVNLSNGTRWNVPNIEPSFVTNLTNTDSTIQFVAPTGDPTQQSSYASIVMTTYVGTRGTIGLNTFLAADNSPTNQIFIGDVNNLIAGSATGTTSLHITNTGGPGAETTGNGIPLVVVFNNGTTAAGAFTLGNGELRAGAFDYRLFHGGINGSDPNDWFLRSSFSPPPGPGPGPEPPFPPEPPPKPLPPGVFPIIGPELATYGVVQPIARQLGLTALGTLQERMGDTLEELCGPAAAAVVAPRAPVAPDCRSGIWGRVFGQQINNRYRAFADPRASGQLLGLQTGFDLWRGSLIPGHRDTAGVYFAFGNGHVDVDGLVTNPEATAFVLGHTGTVNLDAYSLGAYWTHYGPTGWYVDAVVHGTFYEGNATTQFANLPLDGGGIISSLEAGYPIPLPWFGPRFVLEPQGQIIWQQVSFKDANDSLGPVGLGTTSGATGRLGLRGRWTIVGPNGQVWLPYVRANVWRDWDATATTMFGIDPVPLIDQATRLEFAGGVTAKLSPNWSLYAQGGYQFAAGEPGNGIRRDGVKGDFGVRYTW